MSYENFLQESDAAREEYWRSLGNVTDDVLAPLVNPAFMGGPEWPGLREAWRVVQRPESTLIVSDGLSAPFSDVDEDNVGFGVEVVAETCDALPGELASSWLFELVYEVSQQCADHGGIAELIEEHGLLSLELPASAVLSPMATQDNSVGVLLGVEAPTIPKQFLQSAGPVRVVTVKLLCPSELDFVVKEGRSGREELVRRFRDSGEHHLCSLKRASIV